MRNMRDESGQAMVITILAMTCLIGFAALATDIGMMFRAKRLAQTAADAAAIAGASEINYGDVSDAATAAATQNGFTAGTKTTVTINNPPLNGPHAGAAGYVEAIITYSPSTVLLNLFGLHTMTVAARAVAENGGASTGCVYVLAPTGAQTMELQGSFDVSAPTCGIVVNSSDPDALDFTGAGGSLTAGSVGVVGGAGGHTGDSTPTPVGGIAPQSDPLGYVTPPTVNSAKTQATYTGSDGNPQTVACTAGGTLTGALTATAGSVVCYSGNVTLKNVTLANATYVFTGNVTLSGTVSSVADGSTIDINAGTLSINTGTTLDLIAPTTGAYNGIALMQPLANTNQITIQKGDASGSIYGIIYAPGAELYLQDSGGDKSGGLSLTTDLIVNKLYDKTATLTIASYSQSVGTSPLTRVALVE